MAFLTIIVRLSGSQPGTNFIPRLFGEMLDQDCLLYYWKLVCFQANGMQMVSGGMLLKQLNLRKYSDEIAF